MDAGGRYGAQLFYYEAAPAIRGSRGDAEQYSVATSAIDVALSRPSLCDKAIEIANALLIEG
jgi:hypothetical protein